MGGTAPPPPPPPPPPGGGAPPAMPAASPGMPAAAPGPRTGVEVTTKMHWLQWIYFLITPVIVVDGAEHRQRWGICFFDLAPGRHRIEFYFRYIFFSKAGYNFVDLDLAPGQVRRIQWHGPWIVFMKGKITEL